MYNGRKSRKGPAARFTAATAFAEDLPGGGGSGQALAALTGGTVQAYGQIDSGSPGYDAGTICYKEYTLSSLPDNSGLTSDLRDFLALYADYYGKISEGEETLPVKDALSQIKGYIASKGFSYEEGLIENFSLSLKSACRYL